MPAVWWVNQTEPQYSIDLKRGYRWSPSKTKSGGVREAWRCLEDMVPGDIWLSWEQQAIIAVGVVTATAEPCEWPAEQDDQDSWPGAGGCIVRFDDFKLERPIKASEIPDEWKREAGPFRANLWVKLSSVEAVVPAAAEELREMFADRWPAGSPWVGVASKPAPNRQTRYGLNIHTPETWERFSQGNIEVASSLTKGKSIARGDIFINFVTGDGGRWVSAEEIVSDARPARSKPYAEYDSQWEWAVRPLTARLSLDDGIVTRKTVSQLEMFRGHEANWGVRVRRSGVEIPERDAELIMGWIDAASEGMS